jgi:flagellar basal-body rod modification protein FlgD
MSRIPTTLNSPAANQPFSGSTDAINDLDMGTFLRLMIAELQNQDPLNPLDNKDMLAQISQIREVGATDKLTETLNSVLLGQNIASSTNLIGADVDAVSDDNQRISGRVARVSIENGAPKLELELATHGVPSIEEGELAQGEYSYRIEWLGDDGRMKGLELSGDDAISTESGINNYTSVRLENLPVTPGAKRIYRTDKSGEGDYQLIATITDGTQSLYLDTTADGDRSETRQTAPLDTTPAFGSRRFRVSLNNVSEIRAPSN